MVWGQIIPLFLLIILHGRCGQFFKALCHVEICQCGENVTVTCDLTYPPEEISLEYDDKLITSINLTEKEGRADNGTIAIEWTEDKMKVNISKVMFSNAKKYALIPWEGSRGNPIQTIIINVSGICEPEISENSETGELECEAESEENALIVWNVTHLNPNTSVTQLDKGYKLRSSLKITEEIKNKIICCYVSTENESYNTKESGTSHGGRKKSSCWSWKELLETGTSKGNKQLSSKNSTIPAFLIPLAVALVAVAFWYLLKRRNTSIVEEAPEEQKTATITVARSCII
ncbi:uncharacterized protein LOC130297664 [Hyla sarda]|uniref:uncharacterized protein LOC130297664 n=1 Tax=Hyla sarda TaxID=327740 RepID=UPI0024C29C19|nr:uncharacterized protein LOC130297664 [Hyla sarda]